MEHERQPLGGGQRIEHDVECQSDRVGQERFVFGVHSVRAADDRIGHVRVQRLLASHLTRPQHVQAHPRDDGRQPSAQVLDILGSGPAEPQPDVLNRVVRFGE